MTRIPFLIIVTVILPAASGTLSFVTPGGMSVKVCDELPHLRVTILDVVAKTTTQRLSYVRRHSIRKSRTFVKNTRFTGVQSNPYGLES